MDCCCPRRKYFVTNWLDEPLLIASDEEYDERLYIPSTRRVVAGMAVLVMKDNADAAVL